MLHHSIRAGLEIEIEDFGRSRVTDAAHRIHRQRGLAAFTDEALDEMLVGLRADYRSERLTISDNRALRAVAATTDHQHEGTL